MMIESALKVNFILFSPVYIHVLVIILTINDYAITKNSQFLLVRHVQYSLLEETYFSHRPPHRELIG